MHKVLKVIQENAALKVFKALKVYKVQLVLMDKMVEELQLLKLFRLRLREIRRSMRLQLHTQMVSGATSR